MQWDSKQQRDHTTEMVNAIKDLRHGPDVLTWHQYNIYLLFLPLSTNHHASVTPVSLFSLTFSFSCFQILWAVYLCLYMLVFVLFDRSEMSKVKLTICKFCFNVRACVRVRWCILLVSHILRDYTNICMYVYAHLLMLMYIYVCI